MNILEAANLVGKDATYRPFVTLDGNEPSGQSIKFAVTVLDVRTVYGRTEILIEPCGCAASGGQAWVRREKLAIHGVKEAGR